MPRSGGKRLVQLFARPDLHLDGRLWRKVRLANALQRSPNAPRGGDVIILDEHGVEQADTVVSDTTGCGGQLLQTAKAGSSFPGIEHPAVRTCDRIHILA